MVFPWILCKRTSVAFSIWQAKQDPESGKGSSDAPVRDAVALDPAAFLPRAIAVQHGDEQQPGTRQRTVYRSCLPINRLGVDTLGSDHSCMDGLPVMQQRSLASTV